MKTATSLLETTKTTNLAIWHNSLQLLHLQTLVFRSSCTTHSLAACIRNWGQYALSCLPKPERHKPGIDRLCQISGFLARLNATSVKIWHASSGARAIVTRSAQAMPSLSWSRYTLIGLSHLLSPLLLLTLLSSYLKKISFVDERE